MLVAVAAFCFWQPMSMAAASPAPSVSELRDQLLTEKWSPSHLYSILTSSNPKARENLYRAAFSAGPAIIPKLQNALKDDRTATFAARTLAYIGGPKALAILAKLVNDPRNLDLRRFYYGALGGSGNPHDIEILLNKVRTSDKEPDRTVTRDAILALSVSSNPGLVAKLKQAKKDVTDPVIQDDISTAAAVIGIRARYLASAAGKNSGSSVKQAIQTYFIPALEFSPPGQQKMHIEIRVRNLTYSPNKTRVLAAVDFENPQAVAFYHMVVQKKAAGWKVVSVWLGSEHDRQPQKPSAAQPK